MSAFDPKRSCHQPAIPILAMNLMTMYMRSLLWIGTGFTALFVLVRIVSPATLLHSEVLWSVLALGSGLCFALAAAEACGLDLSARSLGRVASVFAALAIVLILDTLLMTRQFQRFWDDPMAIPVATAWFGGVLVYHLRKYRSRARDGGV